MKDKFIAFLKEHGVYEEFVRRVSESDFTTATNIDEYIALITEETYYVSSAFCWASSKNISKWSRIADDWVNNLEDSK